jgi:hypothetical protein
LMYADSEEHRLLTPFAAVRGSEQRLFACKHTCSTAIVHLAAGTMAVLQAAPMLLLSCKPLWHSAHVSAA